MELVLKFLVGGAFVSLFAAIAECVQPKSFAGLFSAAPSIALAGLILTGINHGAGKAVIEARYMVFGSIALMAYSLACSKLVRKAHIPPWLSSGMLWALWLGIAVFLKAAAE